MKWPWVSREMHERMLTEIKEINRTTIARMQAANERLFASNEFTLTRYHSVVQSLTNPVPVITSALRPVQATITREEIPFGEPKEPDPIAQTIREQAGRDTHLANHLRKYAKELKDLGMTADAIVGKLVQWQTSEQEDHAATM